LIRYVGFKNGTVAKQSCDIAPKLAPAPGGGSHYVCTNETKFGWSVGTFFYFPQECQDLKQPNTFGNLSNPTPDGNLTLKAFKENQLDPSLAYCNPPITPSEPAATTASAAGYDVVIGGTFGSIAAQVLLGVTVYKGYTGAEKCLKNRKERRAQQALEAQMAAHAKKIADEKTAKDTLAYCH
jgi:hypothetical protein